jgi:hypothetical protein
MLRNRQDSRADREFHETPSTVVGAVAAGTAPLPFLAVYAVLFIVHGGVHKVAPPDITSTSHGELMAGIVALVVFLAGVVALLWMFNGTRRWPFVILQVGLLATAIDFLTDDTKGGRLISFVVALATVVALVLAFAPDSWEYVGRTRPVRRRRKMPIGAGPASDTLPDSARYVGDDAADVGRDLARAD